METQSAQGSRELQAQLTRHNASNQIGAQQRGTQLPAGIGREAARVASLVLPQHEATVAPTRALNWAAIGGLAAQDAADISNTANTRNVPDLGIAPDQIVDLPVLNIAPLSNHAQTRTADIAQIVRGEHSPSQTRLLENIAQRSEIRASERTDGVTAKIIGAGPTGQLQALKALQQGVPTRIIEKREGFDRDNIFQINQSDFDASVGRYLSQEVQDQLEQLGVLARAHVPASTAQAARDVVVVTIRDLENILHGVVQDQAQRSDGRLAIQFGESFTAEDVKNAADNERIVFAFGSGGVRDAVVRDLQPQGFSGHVNAWQDTPRGAAVSLRYDPETVDQAAVNRLQQSVSGAVSDSSQYNFLHLPQQGLIQVNLQISEDQFTQWVGDSPRAAWGGLDWGNATQLQTANENLLSSVLPSHENDESLVALLNAIDPEHSVWVNEAHITQLTESAALIPRENGDAVPVAFVGDAQATNWFLRGDGNPREEITTDIVDKHFFAEQTDVAISDSVTAINNHSLDEISVHNTAIPGSLYPAGRLQRSPSLPANLDGLTQLGADLRQRYPQHRNINLQALS